MYLSSSKTNPAEALQEIINSGFSQLLAEQERLKNQASGELCALQKVELCYDGSGFYYGSDWINRLVSDLKGSGWASSQPSIERVETEGKKRIEEMRVKAETIHADNLPKIESNKKLIERISYLMNKVVGIPTSWNEKTYPRRNSACKWVEHKAGYITDIERNIITQDRYEEALRKCDEYQKALTDYINERRLKEAAEKRKVEEEERAKQADRALGVWLGKVGLSTDKGWDDVLNAILAKDKYLRLAYWLEKNRGDWNDGPYYAKVGLQGFPLTEPIDKLIHDDIYAYISDWDGDGRVFRDCQYNYSVLYGMADEEVMKEYAALREAMPVNAFA